MEYLQKEYERTFLEEEFGKLIAATLRLERELEEAVNSGSQ